MTRHIIACLLACLLLLPLHSNSSIINVESKLSFSNGGFQQDMPDFNPQNKFSIQRLDLITKGGTKAVKDIAKNSEYIDWRGYCHDAKLTSATNARGPISDIKLKWTYESENWLSNFIIQNNILWLGENTESKHNSILVAINISSGEIISRYLGDYYDAYVFPSWIEDYYLFLYTVYWGPGTHRFRCWHINSTNISMYQQLWIHEFDPYADPIVTFWNGYVLVRNWYADKVICVNYSNGNILWETYIDNPSYVIAVDNGRAYVVSAGGEVFCLSVNNGSILWSYTADAPVHTAVTIGKGRIFFGSDSGYVYCLDTTGSLLWKKKLDVSVRHHITLMNDRIIIASTDGYLHCMDARDGSELWSACVNATYVDGDAIENGLGIEPFVIAVTSNSVYVGSGNGTVYCLDPVSYTHLTLPTTERV